MDPSRRSLERRISGDVPDGTEGIFLVLSLGQKRCAIRAADVKGVLLPRPAAVCPRAGKAVAGVMFYRGSGVTVFDLGWILTGQEARRSRSARLVALREPCWAVLLVDGILGLASGPCQKREKPGGAASGEGSFVIGRIQWLNHSVNVVDIERVLEAERRGETAAVGALTAALDLS